MLFFRVLFFNYFNYGHEFTYLKHFEALSDDELPTNELHQLLILYCDHFEDYQN